MTAILTDLYIKDSETDDEFLFRGSANVYTASGPISEATGISNATDDQSGYLPYTPVKELIRAEIITPLVVTVPVTTNGVVKNYRKTLYYDSNKNKKDVIDALTATTWPTGKGQGQTIGDSITSVRVKSRT